jgi:hypothetical protein
LASSIFAAGYADLGLPMRQSRDLGMHLQRRNGSQLPGTRDRSGAKEVGHVSMDIEASRPPKL